MRVSKYVQSDMRGIFRAVREECEKRPVMFSGTPCQCAALLSYLGGRPENLFVCDLICHSIPSPLVWEEYKKLLEAERGGKIAQVWFRSKRHPWGRANSNKGFACRMEGSDEIFEDDRFYSLFIRERVIARPSCSACRFTDTRRVSDMTIADCFGIEKYAPEWNAACGEHRGAAAPVAPRGISGKPRGVLGKIPPRGAGGGAEKITARPSPQPCAYS